MACGQCGPSTARPEQNCEHFHGFSGSVKFLLGAAAPPRALWQCAECSPGPAALPSVTAVVADGTATADRLGSASGLPATGEGLVVGGGRDSGGHIRGFEFMLSPSVHHLSLSRIATGRASPARGPAQRRAAAYEK